jgi:hypothetical protein
MQSISKAQALLGCRIQSFDAKKEFKMLTVLVYCCHSVPKFLKNFSLISRSLKMQLMQMAYLENFPHLTCCISRYLKRIVSQD